MSNTISSRTPEGFPSRCVLCGTATGIEYSATGGDAPCPNCGHLLWRSAQLMEDVRSVLARTLGVDREKIKNDFDLAEFGGDSMDTVELVMALEDRFDANIDDEDAQSIRTLGDAVRYLLSRESGPGE